MTTTLDTQKISCLLDQGVRALSPATLSSLQQIRAQALQRQAAHVQTLQLAGGRWTSNLIPHTVQQWVTVVFLAMILFSGANLWRQHTHQQQIELDVQILTDELPIEVFLDQPDS